MTFSKPRINGADEIEFYVSKDGEEIRCRIEELWMQQQTDYKPEPVWSGSLAEPLTNNKGIQRLFA
jgi:hypothetical protein